MTDRFRRTATVLAAGALVLGGLAVATPARAATSDWVDASYRSWSGASELSGTDIDSSGRLMVLRLGQDGTATVTRLLADGGVDPSYGTDGVSEAFPVIAGGRVLVNGDSALVASVDYDHGLATIRRLNPTGFLDPGFGFEGRLDVDFTRNSESQGQPLVTFDFDRRADGSIVVGGSTVETVASGTGEIDVYTGQVHGYTADGVGDPAFTGRTISNGLLFDVEVDESTGAVLTYDLDYFYRGHLRRFARRGGQDATWNGKGDLVLPDDLVVNRLRIEDGVVYLAGSRYYANDTTQAIIGRLTASGAWDSSFGTDGVAVTSRRADDPAAADVLVSGTSVYVLDYISGRDESPMYLERLGSTGRPDPSFGTNGTLLIDSANGGSVWNGDIQKRPDGRVVIAVDTVKGNFETGTFGVTTLMLAESPQVTPGSFQPLTPARVLDTRSGIGAPAKAVAANGTVSLQVTGQGGVPATAGAVVLNVTAVSPTRACAVTVYPSDAALPTASNLNCSPGRTTPNLVTVKVGKDGKVNLRNGSTGTTQLIADVAGYYRAGTPTAAGAYAPLTPLRLLDTRRGSGPVGAGRTVDVTVGGAVGIPADASAVVLNLTAVSPTAAGVVTAYPSGASTPAASNLNFTKGQTLANLATVKLGTGGKVTLKNGSTGTTQLIADVAGYYLGGTPTLGGTFVALNPTRVLDSRTGVGVAKGAQKAGTTIPLSLLGKGGVPATGAGAVVLNTTITQPTGNGLLTAFPDGDLLPTASNLNFVRGQTVANLVAVKVGPRTKVNLGISGNGTTHVIADVAGYFRD